MKKAKCARPLQAYKSPQGGSLVFNPPKDSLAGGYTPVVVSCGSCVYCRLEQSRVWATRMVMEAKCHKENSFLTLTYAPENLPEDGNLVRKHVQDFLKRLRKRISPKKIRYYYVGEYGDKTGRPHYHVILFGHDFSDDRKFYKKTRKGHDLYMSDLLSDCWPYGFANIGNFTFESAAYCARYCLKKQGKKKDLEVSHICLETGLITEKVPEFGQPSTRPGIGALWYHKYGSDIRRTDYVYARGHKMKVPRYFDKLTEKYFPDEFEEIKKKRIDNIVDKELTCDRALELKQAGTARERIQKTGIFKGDL